MSRGDALIVLNGDHECSELPCIGDAAIVEFELPENHAFGRKCMQCQATIVRVSKSETGLARVALRIHKMRFQSYVRRSASKLENAEEPRPLVM